MSATIITIGLVSISDRASANIYEDKGIPTLKQWLTTALNCDWKSKERLINDDFNGIQNTLIDLINTEQCGLILTTGGTGPAVRDVTPEATLSLGGKEMPGFGEQMRQISLQYVPTAILSRQTAVVVDKTLIINLPGQPKAIAETLDGLFAAIPYCLDLIGASYITTDETVIKTFRPKQK